MKYACALFGLILLASAPVRAESWVVAPANSKLGFSGSQSGAPFQGRFKTFTASIEFDPAKPEAGHAAVDVEMASASSGDIQRDESLPQSDWFDVAKFPKARFEATQFGATGGDAYAAVGKLTIRGVSVACVLPFTLVITGNTAHAKGHVQLTRTAFGVGQGAWSAGDMVALEVVVDVDLIANKTPG